MYLERPGSINFPDGPKLELDNLVDQLIENANAVKNAQGRLRSLLQAIESFTGDLSLGTLLQTIVIAARDLADAQYCALGVIGHDPGRLEQFVQVGVDAEVAARIGRLPQGRGLLGALIVDSAPIRLRRIGDDERSVGFPPGHPPMESFLGVPVVVRGAAFGNLYLTNSRRGEFTVEDEQLVTALAHAAGTAISNARLYREAELKQRWLEASAEISSQIIARTGEEPLGLIARRAMDLAGADIVSVSLLVDQGETLAVEVAFGAGAEELIGRRFGLADSLGGEVIRSGTASLLMTSDPLTGPVSGAGDAAAQAVLSSALEIGPTMVLPLHGTGRPRGVLSLARTRGRVPFDESDLAMAANFADQASLALELSDSRTAEQKLALLEERDRIAQDLHDHVIQELFAIGIGLEGVAGTLPAGRAQDRIERSARNIDRTIRRIRTTIFELHGNFVGGDGGLRQRVLEVVADSSTPLGFLPRTTFAGVVDEAFDDAFADDVLACVREALSNVAKHARATNAWVDVDVSGDEVTVTVTDDGVGARSPSRSSGLSNLRARAERRRGSFELTAGVSGGTVAIWRARTT